MYYFIACVVQIMICLVQSVWKCCCFIECMYVCVHLQGMATCSVCVSLALRLSDALQGHSFPVPVLDLVSAHPWIHFCCPCRHISSLKNTRTCTNTQTACWDSAGHFYIAHPLRSSSPIVPLHSRPSVHLYPALHLLPLIPKWTKLFRQGLPNVVLRSFAAEQLSRLANQQLQGPYDFCDAKNFNGIQS